MMGMEKRPKAPEAPRAANGRDWGWVVVSKVWVRKHLP